MRDLDFWARTHQGLVRSHNEDAFLWLDSDQTRDRGYLWLVCDGMGGEAGGSLASRTVADQIATVYVAAMARVEHPHRAFEEAMHAANKRLLYLQQQNRELSKMGSTAVAAAYFEGQLWFASVGDSRIYGWSRHGLRQLTRDHTKLEKMIEFGVIKPEEATPDHPAHGVLVNVLGRDGLEVDTVGERHFDPHGKCILLCSDGLSNNVSEEQLVVALRSLDAKDASRFLLAAAMPLSDDNITIQVVRFTPPEDPKPIEEIARRFGVDLSLVDDGPLASNSFDEFSQEWGSTESADDIKKNDSHQAVAKGTILLSPSSTEEGIQDPRSPASDFVHDAPQRSAGGTMMLSPEAIEAAIQQEETKRGQASRVSGTMLLSPEAIEKGLAQSPSSSDDVAKKVASRGGTMLLSPEAMEQALREQEAQQPTIPAEDAVASTEEPSHSNASSRWGMGETFGNIEAVPWSEALTKVQQTIEDEPQRDVEDDVGFVDDETIRRKRTLIPVIIGLAALLLALVVVYIFISKREHQENTIAETVTPEADEVRMPTPVDRLDKKPENRERWPSYQQALVPRPPDIVHEADGMPAYTIKGTTITMDAHGVTRAQYQRVLGGIPSLADAEQTHDVSPACAYGTDVDDNTRRPVCVRYSEAHAYCEAVGRELPSRAQWEILLTGHASIVAKGYGVMLADSENALPPQIEDPVTGISAVYDGLPEILRPHDAQKKNADLVVLDPRPESFTRVVPQGAQEDTGHPIDANTVIAGFRCVDKDTTVAGSNGDAKPRRAASTTARPSKSTSGTSKSASSAPKTTKPTSSHTVEKGSSPSTPDAATPSPEAPNDAAIEAPSDPAIPNRSHIIQEMRERQNR